MVHDHPLKTFRENQQPPLSQADLAKLLNVSVVAVWRWETGKRQLDKDRLALVSEKTGIPARELRPDLIGLAEAIMGEQTEAAE